MQASRTTKNLSLPKRVLACLMSAALCMAFAPAVAWGDWDPPLLTITGDESGYTIFTFDFSESSESCGSYTYLELR